MTINPRETLDQELESLLNDILYMGEMVGNATTQAVEALKNKDLDLAHRIYDRDKVINDKKFDIENIVMILIATQQPMARDARILASVLEVANQLERIGDYAKGIARICILMADHPPLKSLVNIPHMAETAVGMLHQAIDAFTSFNEKLAREIPKEDDLIDSLYNQAIHELISLMVSDPTTINCAYYLMWAAHNMERMADRVTNICERTIYVVTGLMEEIKPSDDEQDTHLHPPQS